MSAQPAPLLKPAPSTLRDTPSRELPQRIPTTRDAARWADRRAAPADPDIIREDYFGNARLLGRVALITGGGAGLCRAVALHYAREGARVVIAHDDNDDHAEAARDCRRLVRMEGSDCLLFGGDLRRADRCREVVACTIEHFGHLDILINNGASSAPADLLGLRTLEQFDRAFRNRMLSYLLTSVEALPRLRAGGSIINTVPMPHPDASRSREGVDDGDSAIHAFTVSLAEAAAERGIRVNAVAPGPVWADHADDTVDAIARGRPLAFGAQTLLGRAGLPAEVAPAYVFLASDDATFITGQTLHVNGGGPVA